MANRRPTVLVVDDEEDIRHLVERMLNRRGYDVLTAGDAAQAILTCRLHADPIAALVTDLGLPGVSGGELARSAAALRPAMGIVYISAYPRDTAIRNGLIPAGALLVSKPFTADMLAKAISSVLSAT